MLLYIITNAVLFSFILTNENIPNAPADWFIGKELGVVDSHRREPDALSPATSWSRRRNPHHGADPVPHRDDPESTRSTWGSSST
jgi:hypothetical protein